MRSRKTYAKALRAARSVMRGNARKATSALTGLAFLAAPACSDDAGVTDNSASDTAAATTQDVVEDMLREMGTDSLAPEIRSGANQTTADATDPGPSTDVGQGPATSDVTSEDPVDTAIIDAATLDAATEGLDVIGPDPSQDVASSDASSVNAADGSATAPLDGSTAEPEDVATVEPVDITTIETADATTTELEDVTTVEPTDTTTTEPEDVATVEPLDTSTIEPDDITTIEPEDVATVDPVDITSTEPDDITTTADDVELAEADIEEETCLETCMQPTGQACETHDDCDLAEVMGTCADSGEECTWVCDDQSACEGYQSPQMAYFDPTTNELNYTSQVGCLNSECHHGQMINADAGACCESYWTSNPPPELCENVFGMPGGCIAWGPPAPPVYTGLTLDELLGALA